MPQIFIELVKFANSILRITKVKMFDVCELFLARITR